MARENFKVKTERQYGKALKEILKNFAARGMNYTDLANETGFTSTTVHKWCKRYNTILTSNAIGIKNQDDEYYKYIKEFQSPEINRINFLSRGWM